MLRLFTKKPITVSLIIIAAGILIASLVFVYYGFHLGIKPCKGLPSDAANCGDGDFGGVIFIFTGIPIASLGIVSLLVALLLGHFKPDYDKGRFLKIVYFLLAALIICLLAAMFG